MMRIAINIIGTALCAATLMPAPALAEAGPGERLLKDFLTEVITLRADFEQSMMDGDRRLLQEAAGTLAVHRPGRFRWDYTSPESQVIVADGTLLWLYDADLGQVTVRELDETLASTPAMLLSGSADIDDHSEIIELCDSGDMTWVEVIQRVRDTDFDAVRIGFHGGELAVMELVDGLGQVTRITFRNLIRNPTLDPGFFEFTPPPGTDIIGPGE